MDGAVALGVKVRGTSLMLLRLQELRLQAPLVLSRSQQTPISLSQAFLQRVRLDQSQLRQQPMHQLLEYLRQGLSDLYQLREQLMLRQLVSRVLAPSAQFPSAQMQALQSPEYLRQERWDLFRLPLLRMSVLLALLALQPLARLRSQVQQTLQLQVLVELGLLALLLPLVLLALLPLGLAGLVQLVRYLLLAIHQLPQRVSQVLAQLAQYLFSWASSLIQQGLLERAKQVAYQLRRLLLSRLPGLVLQGQPISQMFGVLLIKAKRQTIRLYQQVRHQVIQQFLLAKHQIGKRWPNGS
jgi:hypothetical protein